MTLSSGSSATEDSVRSLLLLYSVCDACEFEDKGGPWERSILLPAHGVYYCPRDVVGADVVWAVSQGQEE